jgi:hypothetical protein
MSKYYGDANPVYTYTYTGSLATGDNFSGALTRDAGEALGNYNITQGTLALDLNNYSVSFTGNTFTINKRPITVTATAATKVYGDADPTFSYTQTAGSTILSGDGFSGALSRTTPSVQDVGTYPITIGTLQITGNYEITLIPADFTITTRAVTLTADALSKTYGESDPATLTYTLSPSSTLYYSDVVSGTLVRAVGEDAGTYGISKNDITVSSNYVLTYVGANFTIDQRPITIAADAKSKVYGDSDPAVLTYQVTSGSRASGDEFGGLLSRTLGENVGTYSINRGQLKIFAGTTDVSSNYNITYQSADLTITARPITITADSKTKTYGDTDPTFTFTVTTGNVVNSDGYTGSLSRVSGENIGDYPLSLGTLSYGSNYNISYNSGGKLTISKRAITVKADAISKQYGDDDPELTYQIESGTLVSGDSFTAGTPQRAPGNNVGTYLISQGTVGLSGNYTLTFETAFFTITQRQITVTAAAKTKTYGANDPALTFTNSPDLVYNETFTGDLARATGENIGTYAIGLGTLALSSNYNIVSFVPADLTITAKEITVTADPISKQYGETDPTLTISLSAPLVSGDSFTGSITRATGELVNTYDITKGTLALSSNYTLTFVPGVFTIIPREITITADPKEKNLGGVDPELTYEITSGSLVFGDLVTGSLLREPGEVIGSYEIQQGSLGINSNYNITYIPAEFSIGLRSITITARSYTKVYGTADPDLLYDVTSGSLLSGDALAGTLTRTGSQDVGMYAIGQGTLKILNGNNDVTANYALTFIPAELEITKATLTVTADNNTRIYGEADPAFTFQYSGFKYSDDETVIDTPPTVTTNAVITSPVSSYNLIPANGLDNNYDFSYLNGTYSITKATLTVTAANNSRHYGAANPVFIIQYSGFKNDESQTDLTAIPTASTTANAFSPVGPYTITPASGVSSNYSFNYVSGTLNITKAPVSVLVNNDSRTYGAANPSFTLTYTGLVNNESASVIDTPPTVSTTATSTSDVGPYLITATGGLDNNYDFIAFIDGTLSITKATVVATAVNTSRAYGDTNPTFVISYSGLQNNEDASVIDTAPNAACLADALSAVGPYTISLTGGSDNNYDITLTDNGVLSVTKAVLNVTAGNKTRVYGDLNPTFTFIYSGFKNLETSAVLDALPTASTIATQASSVGTYPITPSGAADTNYSFNYIAGTLTINKATLDVTVLGASRAYGVANPTFIINYSGFKNSENLTVLDTPPVGTTTATVTSPVGTYPITPGGGLDGNYTFRYLNGTLTITQGTLVVTANNQTRFYGP